MRITFIFCACLFTTTAFCQKWNVSEVTLSFGGNYGTVHSNQVDRFQGYTVTPIFYGEDVSNAVYLENVEEYAPTVALRLHFSKPSTKNENVSREMRFGMNTILAKTSSYRYIEELSFPEGDVSEEWFARLEENELGLSFDHLWRIQRGKISGYGGIGVGASAAIGARI